MESESGRDPHHLLHHRDNYIITNFISKSMKTKSLTPQAQQVIKEFLHLPFKEQDINCPYFNNRRVGLRGALRVLVGKGSAKEIVEETVLVGLRDKVNTRKLSNEKLKKFMVDHNLGIDCSALAYYILDAQMKAMRKGSLRRAIKLSRVRNPLRKLVALLQVIKNVNTATLASSANSKKISLKKVQPGDIIILMGYGKKKDRDHVMVVNEVEYEDNGLPTVVHYVHALRWNSDGKYDHGVRMGKIEIDNWGKTFLDQRWTEQGKGDEQNGTLQNARDAERVEIRRLLELI